MQQGHVKLSAFAAFVAGIGTTLVSLFSLWGNGLFSLFWALFLFAMGVGVIHYRSRMCSNFLFVYSVGAGFLALYKRDEYGKFYIPVMLAYINFVLSSYFGMQGTYKFNKYKKKSKQ